MKIPEHCAPIPYPELWQDAGICPDCAAVLLARVAELERAIESWRKEETMWVEREKELNALVDEGIRDIQAEQGYAKRYRDALNVIAQFPDRNSEWLARTAIAALNPAS